MVRQHPDASPLVACIWPASNALNSAVGSRLLCWADGYGHVTTETQPAFHYEVPKSLCGGPAGPLIFVDGGPDQCPLGDDLTVSIATHIDPTTCAPPPGSPVTSVAGRTGAVILGAADIVSGVFDPARIPGLPASQITSGTLDPARIPALYGLLAGVNTWLAQNNYNAPVIFNAFVQWLGNSEIILPGITTPGLVIRQNNTVTTTDTNMVEWYYKTFIAAWNNEKGLPRARRVDSEVVTKYYARGNNAGANTTIDMAQWFSDDAGTDKMVVRIGPNGNLFAQNNLESAWTAITVDSPTTPGKYTTNASNPLQLKIINGGKDWVARGRVDVSGVGVTDEVIASALPTAVALVGFTPAATVSAVPDEARGNVVMGSGGGIRVRANNVAAGSNLAAVGTVAATYIMFDGMRVSLENSP